MTSKQRALNIAQRQRLEISLLQVTRGRVPYTDFAFLFEGSEGVQLEPLEGVPMRQHPHFTIVMQQALQQNEMAVVAAPVREVFTARVKENRPLLQSVFMT